MASRDFPDIYALVQGPHPSWPWFNYYKCLKFNLLLEVWISDRFYKDKGSEEEYSCSSHQEVHSIKMI